MGTREIVMSMNRPAACWASPRSRKTCWPGHLERAPKPFDLAEREDGRGLAIDLAWMPRLVSSLLKTLCRAR